MPLRMNLSRKKKNISLGTEKSLEEADIEFSQTIYHEEAEFSEEIELEDYLTDTDEDLKISFENDNIENIESEPELDISSDQPIIDTSAQDESPSAADLFEQRQRQYLLGKKVTRVIYDSNGEIIVNNGEVITSQIIDSVKANGKLIELVMNYEE